MTRSNLGSDFKAQVLQATDIVQLIGQSVALKRQGKDFVGRCPFHQEKTPSFHVSPAKQFYHCYGCKKHGNAIDFVIERDRVDFKEAMVLLGRQAGIEMPHFGASKEHASERQMLLDAHSATCLFFEKLLTHEQIGAAARAYLDKRGFNAESIKRFRIGLAPDSWNGLLTSAVGKKFSPRQLELAGLAKANQRGDGYYDTFRNRLIFPIRDEGGRIIAFGGRKMREEDEPKYLNSPETALFSKSRCIFGLDLARQRIIETGTVAICEGYTDTVMAHQFGASNVVSIMGTGMTEQHLGMLRRFANRIVLLFDGDSAGEAAVDRVVELFLRHPVEIAIATMPQGLDPDEYLLQHGAEAFEKLLAGATDALEYKWRTLARHMVTEKGDLTGQQKAVQQYLELLSSARGGGPVDNMRWGAALARGQPAHRDAHRRTAPAVPRAARECTGASGSPGQWLPPPGGARAQRPGSGRAESAGRAAGRAASLVQAPAGPERRRFQRGNSAETGGSLLGSSTRRRRAGI